MFLLLGHNWGPASFLSVRLTIGHPVYTVPNFIGNIGTFGKIWDGRATKRVFTADVCWWCTLDGLRGWLFTVYRVIRLDKRCDPHQCDDGLGIACCLCTLGSSDLIYAWLLCNVPGDCMEARIM